MPSPTWCKPSATPIFAACVAAQQEAWEAQPERRVAVFTDTLRRLLGPELTDEILPSALVLFRQQPERPAGLEDAPASADLRICPRCQQLKAGPRAPNRQNLRLLPLRDADWLQQQFERGRTTNAIAKQLGCSPANVVRWAAKHDLQPPRTATAEQFREAVAALHRRGEAPGAIARQLERSVADVRQALTSLGLATKKQGHHYMVASWWEERLVRRQMSVREIAREAGIQPNVCTYWIKRFGLQHITLARSASVIRRRWKLKYPILADPVQLRALLDEHGSYEAVAKVVGCSPRHVSRWARELLGEQPRHRQHTPHSPRAWWVERLERGATTWQLAEEAGIEETSARERLRVLGLLGDAYRNNTAAERERRKRKKEAA